MAERALAAILLVFACAALPLPAQAASAPALVGIWYGKGQPEDPDMVYLDYFAADGSFISTFRKYERCTVVWEQVEAGTWSIAGNVQSTVKTSVNGMPIHSPQDYRVESVTPRELRVRHIGTEYLFVERRLDRYEFPNCWTGV
jgi:hypothetical protein